MTKSSRSRQDRKIKLRPLSWEEVKDLVDVQRYFNVPLGKQSAGETLVLCLRLVAEQSRQAAAKKKQMEVKPTPEEESNGSSEGHSTSGESTQADARESATESSEDVDGGSDSNSDRTE